MAIASLIVHILLLIGVGLIASIILYETYGEGFKNLKYTRKVFEYEERYEQRPEYIDHVIPSLEGIVYNLMHGDYSTQYNAIETLDRYYQERS